MDGNVWTVVLGGGSAGAVIYGLTQIVRVIVAWRSGRPLVQATVSERLDERALRLVERAEKSADAAEKDAENTRMEAAKARQEARLEIGEARQEAAAARREAAEARRAADDAERMVRTLKSAILSPYATVDGLRQMVAEGPQNGVASRSPTPGQQP